MQTFVQKDNMIDNKVCWFGRDKHAAEYSYYDSVHDSLSAQYIRVNVYLLTLKVPKFLKIY